MLVWLQMHALHATHPIHRPAIVRSSRTSTLCTMHHAPQAHPPDQGLVAPRHCSSNQAS